MTNALPEKADRLLALQALRAIAATMIVVLHDQEFIAIYAAAHSYRFSRIHVIPFGAGVDLFFVISGFVIVFASVKFMGVPGGRWDFVRRRLIRIVPLYWTALSLRLIALGIGAAVGTKLFPNGMAIATSFFFIPYDSFGYGPDQPFPILDLGWTLNYEMFFYFLFACFIALRRDYAVLGLIVCLSAGILVATAFPPESVALRFWFRPIAMEFAFGALTAWLFLRGVRLNGLTRCTMLVAGLVLWLAVPVSWLPQLSIPEIYSWARVMIWGTGAALIVAAAVMGPTNLQFAWLRTVAGLGDSSYALYLLHPFVFGVVNVALARLVVPEIFCWPLVFIVVALSILAAAVFHKSAEVPVVTFLRKATARRIAAPAGSGG